MSKFRHAGTADIPPIEIWVAHDGRVNLDVHDDRRVTRVGLSVDKARDLRDWLNLALPDDADAEPKPVQCDRCGNTPCPGCNPCCGSTLGRDPDDGSCLGCG